MRRGFIKVIDMKKLICALLCAVMMFGAVGCESDENTFLPAEMTAASGEPLAPQEYKDTLYATFKEYMNTIKAMDEAVVGWEDVNTISQLKPIAEKADVVFADMDKAICKYYDIIPPEEYKQLHGKLLASVEIERQYIMYMRRAFAANSMSNMKKNTKKASELLETSEENGTAYAKVFVELYQKLKDDGLE